jgi:hypothetical protein
VFYDPKLFRSRVSNSGFAEPTTLNQQGSDVDILTDQSLYKNAAEKNIEDKIKELTVKGFEILS